MPLTKDADSLADLVRVIEVGFNKADRHGGILLGERLGCALCGGYVAVEKHDGRAFTMKTSSNRPPDALRPPADERDLACKFVRVAV
jgi:hypothetical protein